MTSRRARGAAIALLLASSCLLPTAPSAAPGSVALGLPCRFSPSPNYAWTDDDADPRQLTDGRRASGQLWKQLDAVGWTRRSPVVIDLDLGRDTPVAGAALGTAAGAAQVEFPAAVIVLVGDDGETWHRVGDLVEASNARHGPPPARGYAAHRYWTDAWRAHGRWIRFVVIPRGEYFFADEIEVIPGDPAALSVAPRGRSVGALPSLMVEEGIRRRVRNDRAALEGLVRSAGDPIVTARLGERLRRAAADAVSGGPAGDPRRFRAILPFAGAHERLLGVQAKLWRARRVGALRAWVPASPYDPLPYLTADPLPAGAAETATVVLMRGEARPLAINLQNARATPARLHVASEGLPGSPTPDWIQMRQTLWTDTNEDTPVALALSDAARDAQGYVVTIAAGTVGQLWLTLRPDVAAPAGEHAGRIVIRSDRGDEATIALRLVVLPLVFPAKTALHLGGFDYTDRDDGYGVTPANRDALVRLLHAYGVDTPWATRHVLPIGRYDDSGRMIADPDTQAFDAWIARWPGAARYHVFVNAQDTFDGAPMGTAPFEQKVAQWIAFWAAHAKRRGLGADQLALLLVDEPASPEEDERFVAWARVIERAAPDVVLWQDPIWLPPDAMDARAAELTDVFCPLRLFWLRADEPFARFYGQQRARRKRLALYATSGPSARLDSYAYYRVHAWHSFTIGAVEEHFWAFGDDGGAPSWVPYLAPRPAYTPAFLDPDSVTPSKHMEAIRDGLEDYEILAMLRAAGEGREDIARFLADEARAVATAIDEPALDRRSNVDRTLADRVRSKALDLLVGLHHPSGTPP